MEAIAKRNAQGCQSRENRTELAAATGRPD